MPDNASSNNCLMCYPAERKEHRPAQGRRGVPWPAPVRCKEEQDRTLVRGPILREVLEASAVRVPFGSGALAVPATAAAEASDHEDDDDCPDHGDDDARGVDAGHIGDLEDIPGDPSPDDGADDSEITIITRPSRDPVMRLARKPAIAPTTTQVRSVMLGMSMEVFFPWQE